MKQSEAMALLVKVAAYDRRSLSAEDAAVWAEALGGMAPQVASAAITAHFRDSPDVWLTPGHIVQSVRAREVKLLQDAGQPDFPSGLTWAQEQEYRQVYTGLVKAGLSRDAALGESDRLAGVTRPELVGPPEGFRLQLPRSPR